MEIAKQKSTDQQKACNGCKKKQQLIEKYENLIALLKKKAERSQLSQLSQCNKKSIGQITTSYTSQNEGNLIGGFKLGIALNLMQQRRKNSVFNKIKCQSFIHKYKVGQQFLTKMQKLCTNKQREAFNNLKLGMLQNKPQNILCSQSLVENNYLTQDQIIPNSPRFRSTNRSDRGPNSPVNKKSKFYQPEDSITIDQCNYKSLAFVHQDMINSINQSQAKTLREDSIGSFSKKSTSNQQVKNLYKNLFTLQQQKFTFQLKITQLEKHMQDALGRQIKENRKKTESLEMVAEEMAQKNQIIAELQQKITMLQEKYRCETNGVLEDELTQLRKEVQKLQKINIKLDNDLRRTRDKLAETQILLKQMEKEKLHSINKSQQLGQKLFQANHKITEFKSKQIHFHQSCKKIQKIFQKLKHHQKNYFQCVKSKNHTELLASQQQKSTIEEFYKLQLIFVYLYNIEDQSYNFTQYEHLLDEQQLEVLKQIKNKFIDLKNRLQRKVGLMDSIQCPQYGMKEAKVKSFGGPLYENNSNHHQQSIYCHQNLVDGSIFQILNDHRQNDSKIENTPSRTERLDPQKNMTMKLLQMEIQKNKQIQKISELKQKNMYIRNIILNLMKSLQLRQNLLKNQTNSILQLIFDVFEYSEEEKHIIFTNMQQTKQRKFFGFI